MRMTMLAEGSVVCISARHPPEPEDVCAQLERIISSSEFPGVGRAAAFLRYVVKETVEGRGKRIKGYSIAIEVFGRDTDFTQDDPVVRIEAGRLRRSLERYYLVAGQSDPVRIDIPKGGYVPTFTWNNLAHLETTETAPNAFSPSLLVLSKPLWWAKPAMLAIIIASAIVISAFWITGPPLWPTSQRAGGSLFPDRPTLVVAPFANLGEGPEAQLYTVGLTEELLTVLPRFKEIRVFGRETSKSLATDVGATEIRNGLGARYLLAGGVRTSGKQLRVTARLLDTSDGEILWSENYDNDLGSSDLFAIQSDVAKKVATAIAQPYGIMAQTDAASPPPNDMGAYKCNLRFYAYRSELSPEAHAGVRDCLESAVARYPTYATAWAMLSIVYLDESRYNFNLRQSPATPIQRSLQAARRAVQIDPSNTRGLQALMTALFFNRELAESLRVGEQALATNPNDTELMGEFGMRLALGGQWQRGAALLDQAIALNPGGGGFYHGSRALAAFMLRDNATAVLEIRRADLQKFPLFHAVAAIIYAESGMMDDAHREGQAFIKMHREFLPNVVTELEMRNVQPADRNRIIEGLRKAGMTVPDELALTANSERQPR